MTPDCHRTAKGIDLERSLSVLLPVQNAQATLEAKVAQVLDVLPDLTNQFDVLIIDDGSTDATTEIGYELAKRYPQVKFVRHAQAMGMAQSLHTGLGRTRGEIVFVHDYPPELEAADIARLWDRRNEKDFAAAIRVDRPMTANKPSWISKLLPWKAPSRGSGFHMLRRRAIPGINSRGIQRTDSAATNSGPQRPNFLSEMKRFALGE